MAYILENNVLKLECTEKGGEMLHLVKKSTNRETLYQGDQGWSGRNPSLFPMVGNTYTKDYEIDGKKYFILFTYVDDDYKYIFYTDNTYNEYKMLNVIFGTYEVINDNYIVKEITEELRKKKAVAIFQEVMKGLKK